MDLFVKENCSKCRWVEKHCDLSSVDVFVLDRVNSESLALLAFNEGVALAEISLPILALGNGVNVSDIDEIAERLGCADRYGDECDEEGCRI